MVGLTGNSSKTNVLATVEGPSTPFKNANRIIPPPLASSTPKKRQHNMVNGINSPSIGHAKSNIASLSPSGINGFSNDVSTSKKRKIAYMEDEDEEDHGVSLTNDVRLNGSARGVRYVKLDHAKDQKDRLSQPQRKLLQEQRKQLPIFKGKGALIKEIQKNDTIILVGETGSGKTTQIPQYILEASVLGSGKIAVTQPRRVAATSLASRVAQEQEVKLGTRVGYAVRFEEKYGPETRIKYVTDGMLARELQTDRLLSHYSVIIIDEAHERTLNTDLLIAALKVIQKERNPKNGNAKSGRSEKGKGKEEIGPLKIVIMSATLDAEKFSKFFDGARILYVKGRQHPIKVYHTTMSQVDYLESALRTFFQIHVDEPAGDVLIFLPGQEDIESLNKSICSYAAALPISQMLVATYPLYASLPANQQKKAFESVPANTRKCILATNMAETSITIPGIRYVIDSGKHKEKRHVAGNGGIDTLLVQDICKSSAMQRTGRAGREGPGACFRLYTEADFQKLPEASTPEILRTSLTNSMLQLMCLGQDIQQLDFIDKPDKDAINAAFKILFLLGAVEGNNKLTHIGRQMNNFPLDPTHARALLASKDFGCTFEVLGIISVLSAQGSLFFDSSEHRDQAVEARNKFWHSSGDHMTAFNVLKAYQELKQSGESKGMRRDWCRQHFLSERTLIEAISIQDQLQRICETNGIDWKASCGNDTELVLKSLLSGLRLKTAKARNEGGYKQMIGNQVMKIHPSSVLSNRKPPIIMYDELVFTGAIYARGVSEAPILEVSKLLTIQQR